MTILCGMLEVGDQPTDLPRGHTPLELCYQQAGWTAAALDSLWH